jgi:pimeloyl-ACP methyl ester carboxylesterase
MFSTGGNRTMTFPRPDFLSSPAAAACILAGLLAVDGCTPSESHRSTEAIVKRTSTESDAGLRMQVDRVGSGRPLVLIGGGLTGSASWEPHAERLAAHREVARLQLLSVEHGLDDRPLPPGYSVRTESQALAAALEDLGWTRPLDLVAWSFGAAVTLDFALNHPERVRTLTLIEPPALWVLPDHGRALPDVQELEALLPDVEDDVTLQALERFLKGVALVPPGATPQALPQWESWVRHRRSLRNGQSVFRHSDDVSRLRAFPAPVLLVTGEGTSPFLRTVHETLAEMLPNTRTLELPGGHAPQLVAMDDFLRRMAEFHEPFDDPGHGDKHIVLSLDGTPIAFWRSGTGPPLLLVHGATADHTTTWRFVLSDLERRFTVYAMDRRGRGGSGDASDYGLQREAEDIAAIINQIGEPMSVLGHSYGALAALEGALLTTNLNRLVLYEGVPLRGADLYPPGVVGRLEAALEAGDVAGMLTAMFREVVGMPPEEVALMRSQRDAWTARLRNAPTLPRELRAEKGYVFAPERFGAMRTPTLLLVGGDSPPRELRNAEGVATALPDACVVVLPGQGHAAMYAAPELFVAEVVRFLAAAP